MVQVIIKIRNLMFKKIRLLNLIVLFISKNRLLPQKIWSKVQPIGKFKLLLPDGNIIYYYSMENDQLARGIVWTNFKNWEFATIKIFCELSKQYNNFIDVGSYSGIYSIINLRINPKSRAFIFEPNPDMIENIKNNLKINNIETRAELFNVALSNIDGKQNFALKKDRTSSCLISENEALDSIEKIIEIQVNKFDELNSKFEAEIVKIDVEGNELNTVIGMERFLTKNSPILIVECLSFIKFLDFKNFIKNLGYSKIFYISNRGIINTENIYGNIIGAPNLLCIPILQREYN